MASARRSYQAGFTLVELLVVIGIIALLIGILLPALAKARKQAQGAACLSNMRQLTAAVMMFTNEHNGWMPGRAVKGAYTKTDPISLQTLGAGGTYYDNANWIAYQCALDPYAGATYAGADENITYSAIAKYLGMPYVVTSSTGTTPAWATTLVTGTSCPISNDISANDGKVFVCPGDNVEARPAVQPGNPNYRYSYTLNYFVQNPPQTWTVNTPAVEPTGTPTLYSLNGGKGAQQRTDFLFNGKVTSIAHQSQIIMFVCTDETTLRDGQYKPDPSNWLQPLSNGVPQMNLVAARHNNPSLVKTGATPNAPNQDANGNVSFMDGHAESGFDRKDALRQKYTGNPAPDPLPANF